MDTRTVGILTQVAFKEAAAQYRESNLNDPDVQAEFVQTLTFLNDVLFDLVEQKTTNTAGAAVKKAFPGTTEEPFSDGTATVQVQGAQHGDLPDWLIKACQNAGVTKVWDNRDGLAQNPKRPWFKAADGTKNDRGDDLAFWPPRGR